MKPQKPNDLELPGLSYRDRRAGCNLYWIARTDIAKRGYRPSTVRLWPATDAETLTEPTREEWIWIASECERLQAEMLNWANGGVITDARSRFDGTFRSLCRIYQTDPDSPYRELRHHTRQHYDSHLRTLESEIGDARLSDLTFRDFKRWHAAFLGPHHMASRAHGLMTKVRLILAFGRLLRLGNCRELAAELGEMEFEMPKKRTQFMTAAQAIAIRAAAHEAGYPSIALAQALQFELMLRQKDVIGEWVPLSEPGVSDISDGAKKWLHGIHWRDIDAHMILRKRTSKSFRGRRAAEIDGAGKLEEFDLTAYPMVMEELTRLKFWLPENCRGFLKPRVGPLVVCEYSGQPWRMKVFQLKWREIADAAGIPKNVQSRDSRAGGITEGIESGASIEAAQKHAGHSTPAMTSRYWRGNIETKNKVAQLRTRSRLP